MSHTLIPLNLQREATLTPSDQDSPCWRNVLLSAARLLKALHLEVGPRWQKLLSLCGWEVKAAWGWCQWSQSRAGLMPMAVDSRNPHQGTSLLTVLCKPKHFLIQNLESFPTPPFPPPPPPPNRCLSWALQERIYTALTWWQITRGFFWFPFAIVCVLACKTSSSPIPSSESTRGERFLSAMLASGGT